jgi:hypothetical protein
MDTKPLVTGTTHPLPFLQLGGSAFERLCLWLVVREGYEAAEHLGALGSEQGRDLIAWREERRIAFQCKCVKAFGGADARKEVAKVLELPEDRLPAEMIFIVTCLVPADARDKAREELQTHDIGCQFWAATELDEKVKRYPDMMEEFFDIQPSERWKRPDRTLEDLYYDAKTIRRELRWNGLSTYYGIDPAPLTGESFEAYCSAMNRLNAIQIGLERLKRMADRSPDPSANGNLVRWLESMEKYVREILHEFERYAPKMRSGERIPFLQLERLDEFTGHTRRAFRFREGPQVRFRPAFAEAFHAAEKPVGNQAT